MVGIGALSLNVLASEFAFQDLENADPAVAAKAKKVYAAADQDLKQALAMYSMVGITLYAEFQNWFVAQWLALPEEVKQAWLDEHV